MAETNDALEEDLEDRHISKGLIFTAIVLFPLIPFALIYLNRKLNKYVRGALIVAWFIFLTVVYQIACMQSGPVVKSINVPQSTITAKVGTVKQLDYKITPKDKDLKISKLAFISSDRSKASIDNLGKIKMTSPGRVTITMKVIDNHHTERKKTVKLLIIG